MRTNAVGRTMDGLAGVGSIVGVESCLINEVRHWAIQDLADFRKARITLGVAANWVMWRFCVSTSGQEKKSMHQGSNTVP